MDEREALDELYVAPLDGFVEARARLSAALAAAGRKADAQALKKARKPSAAAWATNQVVRRARAEVDAFLDASARLRQDQAAMLAGLADRETYQARADDLRRATAALSDAARRVLDEIKRGDDRALVDRVVANARAAALTDGARAALLEGRLAGDVDAGVDAFGGLLADGAALAAAPAPSRAPAAAPRPSPAAPAPTGRELEARRREEERARQLEAARREEIAARAVAETAAATAARARAARDEARRRLDDAEVELEHAQRAAASAEAGAERAARHRARFES
ncbi:MAG TPA: hypothetical protein VK989_01970 [Polyangia bacterium]|jgi:hypothetical protein|nr:hypothetical protein [Polyangia bacterium]